jgi:pyridoxal phosphate enzyme (YggS family)
VPGLSEPLAERVRELRARIERAASKAGRDPASVRLIAVTKGVSADRVREAMAAGLRTFGENRVQEGASKIEALAAGTRPSEPAGEPLATPDRIEWHLIGSLQRNKARAAARLFDVIHSLDRPELALALAQAAEALGRRLPVLLQINVDEEPQKAGARPAQLRELLEAVERLPALEPIGLMAIPRACEDPEQVRPSFARLRSLQDDLNSGRPDERRLREISIGMSADFEVAIEEGATLVRIGSALFGPRRTG